VWRVANFAVVCLLKNSLPQNTVKDYPTEYKDFVLGEIYYA